MRLLTLLLLAASLWTIATPICADSKADLERADTARSAARKAANEKLGADAADFNELRRAVPAMRGCVARLRTEIWFDGANARLTCLRDLESSLKNNRTELEAAVNPDRKKEYETAVAKDEASIASLKSKLLDPMAEEASGVEGVPTDIDTFDKLEAALAEAEKKLAALKGKLGALATDLDAAEAAFDKAERKATNLWVLDEVIMGPESAGLSSDGAMRSGAYGQRKFWVTQTRMVRTDPGPVTMTFTLKGVKPTLKPGEKASFGISGKFEGEVPDGVPGPPGDADIDSVEQKVLERRKYSTPPHTKSGIHCKIDKTKLSDDASGEILVPDKSGVAFVVVFNMWNTGGWVAFRYRRAAEIE